MDSRVTGHLPLPSDPKVIDKVHFEGLTLSRERTIGIDNVLLDISLETWNCLMCT